MVNRCEWCRDPIRRRDWEPYCTVHCRAQAIAHEANKTTSPVAWDGDTQYAVQLPLPLHWRLVCMLCGRDRWLHMPIAEMRQARVAGPCPSCQGFRVVELDMGMFRPGQISEDATVVIDGLKGPKPARPGVNWRVA